MEIPTTKSTARLIGEVASEPYTGETKTGFPFGRLVVKTLSESKNGLREYSWNVVGWGEKWQEIFGKYRVGDSVEIDGELTQSNFGDGGTEIKAQNVCAKGPPSRSPASQFSLQKKTNDDDIPF